MSESIFHVKGMTCDHCVAAVTAEVSTVAGVDSVIIDLATGRLVVEGTGVDALSVDSAVTEAGYELV